jgi:hypothetical protein
MSMQYHTPQALRVAVVEAVPEVVNLEVATAALTADLTVVTASAPGTPDYAVQDLVNTSGYGFVTADEGQTVLAVIANLQTRVAEMEAQLQAVGILA